jgi:hypothetical protein
VIRRITRMTTIGSMGSSKIYFLSPLYYFSLILGGLVGQTGLVGPVIM